jgi:hypothetical protein
MGTEEAKKLRPRVLVSPKGRRIRQNAFQRPQNRLIGGLLGTQ